MMDDILIIMKYVSRRNVKLNPIPSYCTLVLDDTTLFDWYMDADFSGVEVSQNWEVTCYVKQRDTEKWIAEDRNDKTSPPRHVSSQTLNTVMGKQPRYVHNYACTVLSNRHLRVTFIICLNKFKLALLLKK
jgi:hypothetical protein